MDKKRQKEEKAAEAQTAKKVKLENKVITQLTEAVNDMRKNQEQERAAWVPRALKRKAKAAVDELSDILDQAERVVRSPAQHELDVDDVKTSPQKLKLANKFDMHVTSVIASVARAEDNATDQ